MKVRFLDADPLTHATPILAVGIPQGTREPEGLLARLDAHLGGAVARALGSGDMKGKSGDEVMLYAPEGGPERVLLVGVGKAERGAEDVRRMAGRVVRAGERFGLERVSIWMDVAGVDPVAGAQAAAEGAVLAAWTFRELKAPGDDGPVLDVEHADFFGSGDAEACAAAVQAGGIIGGAQNFARALQSRPGNVATPTHLAEEAERVAGETGMSVTILDEAALAEAGMHAILAVSRGSQEEARLIILEHRGGAEGAAPLVLVGKGLTFDAGGISLKPPSGMEKMKFDMSGGAAVLGAMKAVAELNVRANVVGIVPSSENLPSGTAVKPGDVIRTLAGKTVEVNNTDAEGRLILADALAHAATLGPAAVVDCATLTGAVVVGLGHHAAAVIGNDDGLIGELRQAGERAGERCWQLPLWDEYRRQLDSDTADLVNVGGRPGGSITAAAFLREFVGDVSWAHLDIAGTAYGDDPKPYQRKGAYGFPTRLLVEWVRSRSA
ncbi:MAG: leucyl aminopeptidase [Longimicrobiales bacterium]